jgi:Ca2+-binding RTX toxin-like protein
MRYLSEFLRFLSRRGQTTGMRRRASSKRAAPRPLLLEILEDRTLLSFSPAIPPTLAVGSHPQAVVAGDFNGDGTLDLAVANSSSASVSVLLSNGNGTFQAAMNFSTGPGPRSVAVGDFNNDGKLDLVTANAGDMSMLLGNGDGTFQPASNLNLSQSAKPLSVAVGDLNRDGNMDLVVTSTFIYTYYNAFTGNTYDTLEGRVDVLLGNGAGSFAPPPPPAFPFYQNSVTTPSSLTLGDVDGDGKLDVLIGNNNGTVSVLPGTGDGTLDLNRSNDFTTGTVPQSVAVGDLNGDGKLDLVTANNGSNDVSVLLGNGDATFQSPISHPAGTGPTSVALADFNKDGKIDIAVTNATGVNVLMGLGDGAFQQAISNSAGSSPASVAVGDFNGDGFSDLAVTNSGGSDVSVLLNAHDWTTPLAKITGPSLGARNQTLTFTLQASVAGLPANTVFSYDIDWNGDGIVDQTVSGVSGTTVSHSYATGGSFTVTMTATVDGHTSTLVIQAITIPTSVSVQPDPGDATRQALVVDGTASADTIVVSPAAGNGVTVSINGTTVGTFALTGGAAFGRVIVNAGDGNDVVQLSGGLNVPALLFGGNGDDTLNAAGSIAANVLVGGAGNDNLTGGSGNDVLIGGLGADIINGSGGDDIVIGGTTKFDGNQTALCAIMAEWGRTDETYATRVGHLQGKGKGAGRFLNGLVFLTTATVFDDAAVDVLSGGTGMDWFFAKTRGATKDTLSDRGNGETVTSL